jgi:hypothetical protein
MMGMDCCCGGDALISGKVISCFLGVGMPNAVVTVVAGATGGPFVADANGNYSGSVTFPGGSSNVTLSATAPAPHNVRVVAGSITIAVAAGSTNTGQNLSLGVAAGYHCLPQIGTVKCAYPYSNTLHATDPIFGALTWAYGINGLNNGWSIALNPAYTGADGCAGQASIALGHFFGTAGVFSTQWVGSGLGNDCPANSAANAWTGAGLHASEDNTITVVSCMPLSLSIPLNLAVGRRLRKIYGAGPDTITVTE